LGLSQNTYMIYGLLGGAVIIWQHRDNIQRIRQGTERRIGNPATRIQ
jgi:glycerol-3-phosphate acyltransferase PlsY